MSAPWEFEPLWSKTKLFVARSDDADREGDVFPFWSIVALESLGRAALASVHPVLLADPTNQANLLYSLGYEQPRRVRSVPAKTVFLRCTAVIENFTETDMASALNLIELRNEDLHSGEVPFETLTTSGWLAEYYRLCQVLLGFVERDFDDLFSQGDAQAARSMVEAASQDLLTEVKETIAEHSRRFSDLEEQEQAEQRSDGAIRAHAANSQVAGPGRAGKLDLCPSCDTECLVTGEFVRAGEPQAGEDQIIQEIIRLPTGLRCWACGLALEGHGRMHAAERGGTFTVTIHEDPASFYNIEFDLSQVDLSELFADEYGNE